VRRGDLAKLITPVAQDREERTIAIVTSLDLSPLTLEEQRRGLAAMDMAEQLRQEILAHRGGRPFTPESWELLNESRDQRGQELA
jgi:hypothetical protein